MKRLIAIAFLSISLLTPSLAFAQTAGDVDSTQASSQSCLSLTTNIRYRMNDVQTDGQVTKLQDFLQSGGYLASEPTGFFGLQTFNAVKKFQAEKGLLNSGFVGPLTRASVHTVTCGGSARVPAITPAANNTNQGDSARIEALRKQIDNLLSTVNTLQTQIKTTQNVAPAVISQVQNTTTNFNTTQSQTVILNPSSDNFFQITSGSMIFGDLLNTGIAVSPSAGTRTEEILVFSANPPAPTDSPSATYYLMNYQGTGNAFYKFGGGVTPANSDVVSNYFIIRNNDSVPHSLTLPPNVRSRGSFVKNYTPRPWNSTTLTVSVGSTPPAQSVTPGSTATFATYVFDASQSAEDVKIISIPLKLTVPVGSSADLEFCTLFNGSTPLNTGSWTVYYINPNTLNAVHFQLNNGFTVPRGSQATITLKCNIKSGALANNSYEWGIASGALVDTIGFQSGQFVPVTVVPSDGQLQTVASTQASSITVKNATAVSSQNIVGNVANQTLGGMDISVSGATSFVTGIKIKFTVGLGGGSTSGITNLSLVNESNVVVAGPVDVINGFASFTDTITLPVGNTTLTLKGRTSASFTNNQFIVASTNPVIDWTVSGQPAPTLSNSLVTMSTINLRTGTLTVSVGSNPPVQNVIAGANSALFATYIFDASQSAEDLRVVGMPLKLTVSASGRASDLTNCQIFSGPVAITTGSNTVNPYQLNPINFTFDGTGFVVPRGSQITLALKCNLKTGTTGNSYGWGIDATALVGTFGIQTGQSVPVTVNASNGQLQTAIAGGFLTVSAGANPQAQSLMSGVSDVLLATYILDASQSIEDFQVRDLTIKPIVISGTGTGPMDGHSIGAFSSCQIYNGSTALSNFVTFDLGTLSPGSPSVYPQVFSFITPLALSKGSQITLSLKCNIKQGVIGTYKFSIGVYPEYNDSGYYLGGRSVNVIGVGSGTAAITLNSPDSQPLTVIAQTVTLNPSSDNFFQDTDGSPMFNQLTSAGFVTSPSLGSRTEELLAFPFSFSKPSPTASPSATYYQMNYQGTGIAFYKFGDGLNQHPNDTVSPYFIIRNNSMSPQTLTLPSNLKFFGSTVQNPTTRPW